jgi:hypothetical protein
MKHKYLFMAGILVTVLLATAFVVGRVSATNDCLPDTNGNWTETFICWLKDNGISSGYPDTTYKPENNVTQAELVEMLKNQANVPQETGIFLVSSAFGDWVPSEGDNPLEFSYTTNGAGVVSSEANTYWLILYPDLPMVLYGGTLQLIGVEFCYFASDEAILNGVYIQALTQSSSVNDPNEQFSDNTDRTDETCRLYTLTTPVILTADDEASFWVSVNWKVANEIFGIGRTIFIMQSTETIATSPSRGETIGSPAHFPGEAGLGTNP